MFRICFTFPSVSLPLSPGIRSNVIISSLILYTNRYFFGLFCIKFECKKEPERRDFAATCVFCAIEFFKKNCTPVSEGSLRVKFDMAALLFKREGIFIF
jgi:hypothetical protein